MDDKLLKSIDRTLKLILKELQNKDKQKPTTEKAKLTKEEVLRRQSYRRKPPDGKTVPHK
ncbi:hypothetical protein GCM10007063_05640 [Lentibacillus kapialis]|uniref:Uncharacterized protein n=1 Tax=Lentibacillus kapialis TaxID=340214 RepID=A0A917UUE1_9BACI|nr:hypothetical protein [Lentibacillus kapialis]GGJ86019.1 hypothetical protein GCM10007063_05640 [Lentibacillus kapialis]